MQDISASVSCAAQIVNISSTLGSIGEEAKMLGPEANEQLLVMASNQVGYRASKAALNAGECNAPPLSCSMQCALLVMQLLLLISPALSA